MKIFYSLAIIGIAVLGSVNADGNDYLSCLNFTKCLNILTEECREDVERSPVRSSEDKFAVHSKSSHLSRRTDNSRQWSTLGIIRDIIKNICEENNNATNQTVIDVVQCILNELRCVVDQLEMAEISLPTVVKLLECLLEIVSDALSCKSIDILIKFIINLLNGSLITKDGLENAIKDLLQNIDLSCLQQILDDLLEDLFNELCFLFGSSDGGLGIIDDIIKILEDLLGIIFG